MMLSMCDSQNVLVARGGPGGANLIHVLFLGVSQCPGGRAEAIYFMMWSMCDSQNFVVARGGPGGADIFHVLFLGVS